MQTPLIKKFEAGYDAGAKAVNPDVKIQVKYLTQPPDFSGFKDPAKGKTRRRACTTRAPTWSTSRGGPSGTGVLQAAKADKKLAIGVDSDQYQDRRRRPAEPSS